MSGMRQTKQSCSPGAFVGKTGSVSKAFSLDNFRLVHRPNVSTGGIAVNNASRILLAPGNSANAFYYSDDGGLTFTQTTSTINVSNSRALSYDSYRDRFLLVTALSGQDGYSSPDGQIWSPIIGLNGGSYLGIFYSLPNGRLIRFSTYYGNTAYSDNGGITWTVGPTLGASGEYTSDFCTFKNKVYVSRGSHVYGTSDGITWSDYTAAFPIRSLSVFSGSLFGFGITPPCIIKTTDGATWGNVLYSSGSTPNSPLYSVGLNGAVVAIEHAAGSGVTFSTDGNVFECRYLFNNCTNLLPLRLYYLPKFDGFISYSNGSQGPNVPLIVYHNISA